MSTEFPDRRTDGSPLLFRIFFFGAFAFLLYQLLRIVAPFLEGILVAITLALVFYPLHAKFLSFVPGPEKPGGGVQRGGVVSHGGGAGALFLGHAGPPNRRPLSHDPDPVREMRQDPRSTIEDKLPAPVKKAWERVQTLMAESGTDPKETVLRMVEGVVGQASTLGAAVVKNVFMFIFQTVIMIFTLFFIFRDGPRLAERVVSLIPMETAYKTHILHRVTQTLTAVVRGMFLTASVQGLLAGIGFLAAGVQFSVVLGFATAFLALIPFVGAAAVWGPVGVYLFLKGSAVQGIGILLWGGLVVSMVDNFLRPFIIGEKAKLPVVFLFFGTLGGLQAYGPIGLLVGPLTVATVLAFSKIYGEQLPQPLIKPDAHPQ
jgi:predicted PurR-regulated permease PerM